MKTPSEREAAFRAELEELLNKHSAKLVVSGYGDEIAVWMDPKYNQDGDLVEPPAEFLL